MFDPLNVSDGHVQVARCSNKRGVVESTRSAERPGLNSNGVNSTHTLMGYGLCSHSNSFPRRSRNASMPASWACRYAPHPSLGAMMHLQHVPASRTADGALVLIVPQYGWACNAYNKDSPSQWPFYSHNLWVSSFPFPLYSTFSPLRGFTFWIRCPSLLPRPALLRSTTSNRARSPAHAPSRMSLRSLDRVPLRQSLPHRQRRGYIFGL